MRPLYARVALRETASGQFHLVNSNSKSNLSIPIQFQFQIFQFQFRFLADSLPTTFTLSWYSKYLFGIPTASSLYSK